MSASFWFSDLFFSIFYIYILTALIVCFHVVCATSAAHAVLFLVGLFLLVSFTFILIGAEYVGLIYIIVYVGAIAVLFLFVVMLLDLRNLVMHRFKTYQSLFFSWTVMVIADLTLYLLEYSHLPFFSLPLIPVLSLVNKNGERISIVDNVAFLSPELFNVYSFYVLGSGFILAFVMVGVVVMLGQGAGSLLVGGLERDHVRNKMVVSSNRVVYNKTTRRDGV